MRHQADSAAPHRRPARGIRSAPGTGAGARGEWWL